jgi:hypothetical protein
MAWRGNTPKPIINTPPNKINRGSEMSDMKKQPEGVFGPPVFGPDAYTGNRAYNIKRDNDDGKDFSIKLLDVDGAILSHLDQSINPVIVDSGRLVKVPINYASPERWKAIRKDGAIRDKNGKIQTPAMVFRRSTVQRNDQLLTLNRYLQYPVVKKFSEKNKYDKFSVMKGFSPKKEIYSVAMPDHVIINYEFIIWTELVEQCNSVVEAINFATEDYWGDKQRFKFRTSISDYNFETSVDAGQDRVVKATFSLMCYAYLLPNGKFEGYKSTVQKAFTLRKVVFGVNESIVDLKDLDQTELTRRAEDLAKGGSVSFSPDIIPQRPQFNGIVQNANYAFNAGNANISNYANTASYVDTTNLSGTFNSISIVGGGATGSFATNIVEGVNSDSGSVAIDSIPIESGNAARWLVSVNDGNLNFKTTEIVANWNNYAVKFNNTETNQIGSVPVHMSVSNVVSGSISLVATPLSGVWTLKMIRMMV